MNLPVATLPPGYAAAPDVLAGRVILVTGAGQGLGRIAALAAARHGASVILHGRNVGKLEAVYDEIEAAGLPMPAIMPLDYLKATQADLDGMATAIHGTFKQLDGIFHGASHFVSTMPLALTDLAMWQKHLTVNVAVPAALTKACLPMLKRAPDAPVVFLTETHALAPSAYWGPFATGKSALGALAAILDHEARGENAVRANVCLPGTVATPMRAQSHPGEHAGQLRPAEDLAPAFVYLMGADSREVSGCLLDATGRGA